MKTSLNGYCQKECENFRLDISSLKPTEKIPDRLEDLGISHVFWKNIVIPALHKKFNNKCCLCGSKRFLEVHHKSYEEQTIDNLFLVCKSCHTEIHNSKLDNKPFVEFYREGITDQQIAEKLGVTRSSIFRRRHKLIRREHEV